MLARSMPKTDASGYLSAMSMAQMPEITRRQPRRSSLAAAAGTPASSNPWTAAQLSLALSRENRTCAGAEVEDPRRHGVREDRGAVQDLLASDQEEVVEDVETILLLLVARVHVHALHITVEEPPVLADRRDVRRQRAGKAETRSSSSASSVDAVLERLRLRSLGIQRMCA